MNSETTTTPLRWGILGTGTIAKKFASGLIENGLKPAIAVGSRSLVPAQKFAFEHGGIAYDSYQAVLNDPEVDAVYISLPHHLHVEWTIKCAQAGKHILCEKPFTWDFKEAVRALEIVKAHDVFFMEAFMYRCHPQTIAVYNAIKEGKIGTPYMMHGEFGYRSSRDKNSFRFDPEVGGGALLDVGCYPISMAKLLAGKPVKKAQYSSVLNEQGSDEYGIGSLIFEGDFRASFACGMNAPMKNQVVIYGTEGHITIQSPWFCNGQIELCREGQLDEYIQTKTVPQLWGHQANVVQMHLHQRQSQMMSWNDTLANAQVLDGLYKRVLSQSSE